MASPYDAPHFGGTHQFSSAQMMQAPQMMQMMHAWPAMHPGLLGHPDMAYLQRAAQAQGAAPKLPRWSISKQALKVLEETFRLEKFPSAEMRRLLAADFGVAPRQVQFWFQNRRQRERRMQAHGGVDGAPAPLALTDGGEVGEGDDGAAPEDSAVPVAEDEASEGSTAPKSDAAGPTKRLTTDDLSARIASMAKASGMVPAAAGLSRVGPPVFPYGYSPMRPGEAVPFGGAMPYGDHLQLQAAAAQGKIPMSMLQPMAYPGNAMLGREGGATPEYLQRMQACGFALQPGQPGQLAPPGQPLAPPGQPQATAPTQMQPQLPLQVQHQLQPPPQAQLSAQPQPAPQLGPQLQPPQLQQLHPQPTAQLLPQQQLQPQTLQLPPQLPPQLQPQQQLYPPPL